MEPAIVAQLINLGSAGAVIIVVVLFLRAQKERDAEWRDFFTELNKANCEDAAKRLTLTERIAATTERSLLIIQTIDQKIDRHDERLDERIGRIQRASQKLDTRPKENKP